MCHLYCHLVCTGFTHPGSHQILENLRCTFGWICLCLALLGGSHSDLNEKTWDLGFPGTSPVDRDSFFSFSFDRVQKHLASSWKLVHGWGKWLVNCETTFENFMDFMLEIRHEPTSPRLFASLLCWSEYFFSGVWHWRLQLQDLPADRPVLSFITLGKLEEDLMPPCLVNGFFGEIWRSTRDSPTAVMKRKSLLSGSETGLTLKWNHLLHQWRLESPGLRDYQSSSDPKKQDLKEQNSDRCLERWVVWNLIKSPHDPTCPNLFPPKPPPEKKIDDQAEQLWNHPSSKFPVLLKGIQSKSQPLL